MTSAQRVRVFKQLAETQIPRIAALEILAEDIRQGLTPLLKNLGPTSLQSLSPKLATRIAAYQKEKLALRKLLQEKLKELGQGLTPNRVGFAENETTSSSGLNSTDANPALPGEDRQKPMRDALAAFNRANADRFAALGEEKKAIRGELARFVSDNPDSANGKSVDALLKDFDDSAQKQEAWQLYGDYEVAVFQPGLSPEQRRLLFDGAVEKLALPLPGGEYLP